MLDAAPAPQESLEQLLEYSDFLVVRNTAPWLLVESKLTDGPIDRHHFETMSALTNVPFIQVCMEPNVASMQKRNAYRMSACRLFV